MSALRKSFIYPLLPSLAQRFIIRRTIVINVIKNGSYGLKSASSPVRVLVAFGAMLTLVGCARHYPSEAVSDPYGFFSGIWHGVVFPYAVVTNIVSWILSLFDIDILQSIQIIGRPNTGFLFYYVGFWMGLSTYGGAGAAASR